MPEPRVADRSPSPLAPGEVLAREWPGLRCRLLDVAATLDRIERAGVTPDEDPRLRAAARAICEVLPSVGADRAERLLSLLSLPYDPDWRTRFGADEGGR